MRDPVLYSVAVLGAVDELTAREWPLFPCKPNKSPYTAKGFKDATLDRDRLQRSFTKRPDALIGLATGGVSKIFVVDLDVDPQKGVNGSAWLADQVQQHGALPLGPVATTPRGGKHLYFRYPAGRVKCSAGKIAAGVDVRGDGGYIIAPPSQSEMGRYEWVTSPDDAAPPDAPEWLLALVCEPPPKDELAELDLNAPLTADDWTLANKEIERQVSQVQSASVGTRNTILNAAAYCCGKLVGAGVAAEEEVIAKLSAAAERAGLPEQEAKRTIRSGISAGKRRPWRPYAASPRLTDLNREYFLAIEGKGAFVFQEDVDPISRNRSLGRIYPAAFREIFSNQYIESAEKKFPLGQAWFSWRHRRQYDKVVFAPGRELPANFYNQWQGFAVEPAEGECSRFIEFVRDVICTGDQTNFNFLISWCARAVQQPWRQGEVAVALRGRKGVGKGTFAERFGELFGDHYVTMADSRHLVGNFNAHLETAIVVFADEAFWAGDKAGEGVLKMLITGRYIRVERKGIDSKSAPNYTHLIMASNSDWVVPATHDERRYFVLDVSEERQGDHAYFDAIEAEWQAGGREAFLYYLQHLEIRDFNVRRVPQTEALGQQKLLSLPAVDRWYLAVLENGVNHQGEWVDWVDTGLLYLCYVEFCRREQVRVGFREAFGMRLNQLVPSPTGKKARSQRTYAAGRRSWGYEFPPLSDCRDHFEKRLGLAVDWGASGDVPVAPEGEF